ncbi:MAG: NADH-quinone oxidoreductase subunit J [Bacteroidota bacterium]
MSLYAFYFVSFLAVMSALMVVFSRNPIYSVLYLVITFFCVACHYLLLNAQFLAAVHIIVYAGAIMVLFLYVIMLLNLNKDSESSKSTLIKFAAVISAGLLMVVIIGALRGAESARVIFGSSDVGLVKNLGMMLFNEFLLPFEIVSILLLAAMVGAVMLGKTHMKRVKEMVSKENGKPADTSAAKVKNVKEFSK